MPFGDGLSNPYRWSQGGFMTCLSFFGFLYTYCMPGKNMECHIKQMMKHGDDDDDSMRSIRVWQMRNVLVICNNQQQSSDIRVNLGKIITWFSWNGGA